MTHNITITLLDIPEACGDWHDKPLRYVVNGPGVERQKFALKKDAKKYASIRRTTSDQWAAINRFVHSNW